MDTEKYGKDRKAEIGQRSQIGDSNNQSGGLGTSTNPCNEHGDDQIGVSGTVCQGRDASKFDNSSEGKITGGILEQLIAETRNQLEESESRTTKLRKRLEQLEKLSQELPRETGEVQ